MKKKESSYILVYLTEHHGEYEVSQNFMLKLTKSLQGNDPFTADFDKVLKKVSSILKKWRSFPDKQDDYEKEKGIFTFNAGNISVKVNNWTVISEAEKEVLANLNLVHVH